jgi:hypothetical protein
VPDLQLHPSLTPDQLLTQAQYTDAPRSTCPDCGHHLAHLPRVVRDDAGAMLGVRIRGLHCSWCQTTVEFEQP